jgi:hypothetical protein
MAAKTSLAGFRTRSRTFTSASIAAVVICNLLIAECTGVGAMSSQNVTQCPGKRSQVYAGFYCTGKLDGLLYTGLSFNIAATEKLTSPDGALDGASNVTTYTPTRSEA